jgi:hypothetical protein
VDLDLVEIVTGQDAARARQAAPEREPREEADERAHGDACRRGQVEPELEASIGRQADGDPARAAED